MRRPVNSTTSGNPPIQTTGISSRYNTTSSSNIGGAIAGRRSSSGTGGLASASTRLQTNNNNSNTDSPAITTTSSSSSSAMVGRNYGAISAGGRGTGAVNNSALVSRGTPSVGQVLAGLDRGPKTEKGKGIQEDIDKLNEDFFGKPSRPLISGNGASSGEIRERLVAATTINTPTELCRSVLAATVAANRWSRGPIAPEGVMIDLSDRNLLCMDVSNNLCVAGSADHGLVLCDIDKKRKIRSLYTKTAGHSEWVTACKFTPEGKILSGGMDSKLCLWFANAPRCDDLMGHTGSVSDVIVNEHNFAISASYDRTLRVWDLSSRRCNAVLSAHSQPVMHLAWKHSALVSGDRGGKLHVWDGSVGKSVVQLKTKGGQIGALDVFAADGVNNLVCAGDQTGTLSVWDFQRTGDVPIFQNVIHPGGVLCDIKQSSPGTGNGLLVTAGADRKIQVLEPRQNMQPVCTFSDHKDFIYSLQCAGDSLVLSGGGNGWLLAHDIKTGKCLYGIGASTAAVRSIGFTSNRLCCAGDDGKLAIFDFP